MAGSKAQKASEPEKVALVSPDGEIEREVVVGSKEETGLRWDGYLPRKQQELPAPPKPQPQPGDGDQTVGTNA